MEPKHNLIFKQQNEEVIDCMAYKITDECISCGACEAECPNNAISEGETIYVIDSDKCTECAGSYESSKCAEICPVDCCVPDPDHPASK